MTQVPGQRDELLIRLNKIADIMPMSIYEFRLNSDGTSSMPYATRAIEDVYGFRAEQIAADFSPAWERIHCDDRQRIQQALEESARTMALFHCEWRVHHPTRGEIWVECRSKPERNPDGSVSWYGYFNDVTDRKRAEERMRKLQQEYAALVNTIDGIVWESEAQTFRFTFVSPQAERILGYPLGRWLDEPSFWRDHIHPDDRDWAVRYCASATAEGHDHNFQYRMMAADGRAVWLHDLVTVVTEDGRPAKLRGIMVDITERKRAEDALRRSEADLQLALDAAGLGDWKWNIITSEITWSARCKAIYGLPPDAEINYERLMSAIHPDDRERIDAALRHAVETRTEYDVEKRIVLPDGSVRWTAARARVFCNAAGQPELMTGVTMDITERKRAEELLREREQALRTLEENTPDDIIRFDRDGRLLYVNPSLCRSIGAPQEFFLGKTLRDLNVEGCDRLMEAVKRAFDEGVANSLEAQWTTASGLRTFDIRHVPERDGSGRIVSVLGIARDISERKRAEESLRAREREFRTLVQNTPDNVARFDHECRAVYINPAMEQTLGIPAEQVLGKTPSEATPGVPAVEAFEKAIGRVLKSGLAEEMEVIAEPLQGRGRPLCNYIRIVPERDSDGTIVGVLAIGRDITELKQAEEALRRINVELEARVRERTAQLEAANKELETFAYSVSHDLKAPLRGIDGYSRLLQEHYAGSLDEEGRTFVANVRRATAHMSTLIDDLLAYSRMERQRLHATAVNLADVVQKVLAEVEPELRTLGVALRVEVPPLDVRADREGLTVVLRNVVDNAIKFSRDARPPSIEIVAKDQGEKVQLSVHDNGIGFDMRFHERIFEIFQRLQRAEEYPGTGVGLALVRKAMQRMGGRVWAESAAGRGATFHLELPK